MKALSTTILNQAIHARVNYLEASH
jgi:hypothetical protein